MNLRVDRRKARLHKEITGKDHRDHARGTKHCRGRTRRNACRLCRFIASFQIVNDDFERIFGELMARSEYSQVEFDTYPTEAKIAIMDMAFNLGARRTAETFKKIHKGRASSKLETGRERIGPATTVCEAKSDRSGSVFDSGKKGREKGVSFLDPDCRRTRYKF